MDHTYSAGTVRTPSFVPLGHEYSIASSTTARSKRKREVSTPTGKTPQHPNKFRTEKVCILAGYVLTFQKMLCKAMIAYRGVRARTTYLAMQCKV